jgi:hypothetical protein
MHERRRFLKTMGVGGLAGASVAVGARPASAASDTRSLLLHCDFLHGLTGRVGSNPRVGTTFVLTGSLTTHDGEDAGEVHVVRTVVRSGAGAELTSLDHHVFDLPDGRITGTGLSTRRPDLVDGFAVTGGTGEYEGVRGSYAMEHDDETMGGSGSVRFAFRFDEGIS